MRIARGIVLLSGVVFGLIASSHIATAQTCKDEQAMFEESNKDLSGLVTTIKQESVPDFEKAYHQKSVESKLGTLGMAVDVVLDCLGKAAQDSSATKEVVEACKTQQANYAKLKEKIGHDIDALKQLTTSKDAKDFAGNLNESI